MSKILESRRTGVSFVAPALIVYTIVLLVPTIWSIGYSFYDGNLLDGFTFSGLSNWSTLLHDKEYWQVLRFTLEFALSVTVLQVGFGLGLALLYMFHIRKGGALIRTIVFFPVVLPTVAVAQLFKKMVEVYPQPGLVNALIEKIFGEGSAINFLASPTWALVIMVLMDVWRSMGFYGVLLYAGVVDVPEEIVEAARLDGASTMQLIRRIVLPLLKPVLFTSILFSINGTIKVYDTAIALTRGGPGISTTPLSIEVSQQAFNYGAYGYGTTIATSMAMISLVFSALLLRFNRKDASE